MKVYLCRHAQEAGDGGITRLGRRQSRALARFLAHSGIKTLYTSDLPRAVETAGIVGERLGLTPQPSKNLREIQVSKEDWTHYVAARHPDFDYHADGEESINDLLGRAKDAWEEIVHGADGNVAVVCHGIFIKALLYHLGYKNFLMRNDHIANTGVTILEVAGGKATLVKFNSYRHLLILRLAEVPGNLLRRVPDDTRLRKLSHG
jgi:broad specificity phosphatase PhoE